MFKYNELSDLVDGSLVTPLSMEDDGTVLCLTKNNEKKYYTFDDFDFSKKVEDRKDPIPDPIPDPDNDPTINDIIDEMSKDQDDSYYDGTDDTEPPEAQEEIPTKENEEGFLTKEESREILDLFELGDSRYNHKIWKDIISLT